MKTIRILLLCLAPLFLPPAQALSKPISLPMTIDYGLLRSLVVATAFTDPGQTAVVVDEGDGCVKITVSEPTIREENSLVTLETRVHVRAGLKIAGFCMAPIEWDGMLAVFQKPKIDGESWLLSFETKDSAIYNKDHEPAVLGGIVWDLVKTRVYEYLTGITINLAPPLGELQSFLLPLFPKESIEKTKKMIFGMKPGEITATQNALRIDILTDVEEVYEKEKDLDTESISDEDLQTFLMSWEYWDAFLVNMILTLSRKPLTEDQRQVLLDVLLTTRFRLVSELSDSNVQTDFVRDQFITAWKQLSPIFRYHLMNDLSANRLMGYVAFFTASDALTTLDKIGPTLGIEISRNGLIRLAQLVAADESSILSYSPDVSGTLRKTLGLGPPLPFSNPMSIDPDEEIIEPEGLIPEDLSGITRFSLGLFPAPAMADEPADPTAAIEQWILSLSNVEVRLEKLKSLLDKEADNTFKKKGVGEEYRDLYRLLVPSVAWQESCFRQFKWNKGKVAYLRSYNKSSVGIMQINERVWRGMYDPDHLRWDISYNVRAGCEILHLYFHRYLLRKMRKLDIKGLDDQTLAGLMYAMYNGGPRQFSRFLERKKQGKFFLSDNLFMEKYIWVVTDRFLNIKKCL